MPDIGLPRITVERVRLPVNTDVDPTGTPPDWAIVRAGATPAADAWEPGTWAGTWAPDTWVDAISPTLIGAGATLPAGVGPWDVWLRITAGGDTPTRKVGTVTVT